MLSQQLRRMCGVDSAPALQSLFDAIPALAGQAGMAPQMAAFLNGLQQFVARVDHTYDQYDRDLSLRARSLELSSAELGLANERMRGDLLTRNRVLHSVRAAVAKLLPADEEAPPILAEDDVEGLSALLPRLVRAQEKRRDDDRRMAETIARSEQRYRTLVHGLKEVVFKLDAAGCWTFLNPAWTDITGFDVDASLGRSFLDFLHRDDVERARVHFHDVLVQAAGAGGWRARDPGDYEVRFRTRDGSIRWVDVHVRNELDEQGNTIALNGTLADITEQHQAAEKIRDSLQFVDALFDAIPIPISLKDTGGRFLRINTAFRHFYELEAEDTLGRTVAELFDLKEDSVHLASERRVIESGLIQTYETGFPDGRRQADHLVSKAALLAADGSVRGVIATTVDISAQKAAMRAMVQAKDAAESASRAKSDFLANMSHEIRTPMNSVIGMAHLALGTELDARQRDYLLKILISGEHLLGLINDILDFSKIEAGKLTLEAAEFDLGTVLDGVLAQVMEKAAAKGVALSGELEAAVPRRLRGDALRLSQVLLNLAGNAVKFTACGAVSVHASLVEEDAAACRLHFEVCDSGIGLSAAEIAGLFQPFHQADTSTTREFGGTGLGLAISKRLVEQMGGDIGVDSKPGQGSRFWFVVRMDKELAPARPSVPDGAAPQRAQAPALAGAAILLVEDNLFNQQVGAEYLRVAGVRVQIAANGVEALAMLASTPFDGVLMDVQMPLMDGLEATRRIRADPALAHLPVVAMTANASAQDRERCLAAGMNEFITKPVSPDKLYRTLAAVLGRTCAPATPAATVSPAPPAPAALIDLGVLATNLNHDAELVGRFAYRFIELAREGLREADTALARQDLGQLAALGHRHKSGARAVGAVAFADAWQSLEHCADSPGGSDPAQLLAALRTMLAEIAAQIAVLCPCPPDMVGSAAG